jgi:hypothetical protein
MQADTETNEPARAARPYSYLFTVRLWKQEVAGLPEYRGSVREVVSGAYRHFKQWADLAAFMIERIEEDEGRQAAPGMPTSEDL